ncbi:inositol-tetrakisphosphate 1-kinase 3 isoform X3 [Miscanthus floridulus]|uniref:inositol-tetrakisphosphate 1-kinase 3 isoform X3 n=1 Tax=Miscanthus floridulus TaxID=154761 RepID=UPI00345929FB
MVSGGCVGAEEEVDPEAVAPAAAAEEAVVPAAAREVVVGYALTSKKAKSFLQPKLRGLARKKGILFVAIDQKRPLSDQGPFDIVLHKLTGKGWQQLLEEYREAHPEVTVLDPPGAIANLLDRQSMLQEVSELDLTDYHVAKPLVAKSHELSLAYDPTSLTKLEPPLVLQEFVNHGGVMFKVYIVGDAIRVVRRFSLPNVDEGDLSNNAGVFRFPRVSCAAASADDADLDPGVAELPPRPLLEILARELRRRLGLRLFNIDMIRQHGTRDRFYVIDMNYFPGMQSDILEHAQPVLCFGKANLCLYILDIIDRRISCLILFLL